MKTKIYLVRHTQTIGNTERRLSGRTDFEVTPDGQKYIEKLTNRLTINSYTITFLHIIY